MSCKNNSTRDSFSGVAKYCHWQYDVERKQNDAASKLRITVSVGDNVPLGFQFLGVLREHGRQDPVPSALLVLWEKCAFGQLPGLCGQRC